MSRKDEMGLTREEVLYGLAEISTLATQDINAVYLLEWISAMDNTDHTQRSAIQRQAERLRITTQMLIAEIGASGPESAESAAGRAVAKIEQLEARVKELEIVKNWLEEQRETQP